MFAALEYTWILSGQLTLFVALEHFEFLSDPIDLIRSFKADLDSYRTPQSLLA
ncbi:hypothetical protein MKY54_11330 [Paenibacillus sp. FSL P2-0121]|uniref:hypothetical protein n=1 Tax=Paenibacillus sp. FSL P2-0121 TaxID=2921626 RepID=UPI0030D50E1A